jgi:hypothetical protein
LGNNLNLKVVFFVYFLYSNDTVFCLISQAPLKKLYNQTYLICKFLSIFILIRTIDVFHFEGTHKKHSRLDQTHRSQPDIMVNYLLPILSLKKELRGHSYRESRHGILPERGSVARGRFVPDCGRICGIH